jgi:hypothetical protein
VASKKENQAKATCPSSEGGCQTDSGRTDIVDNEEPEKILVEIPKTLIEEIKVWSSSPYPKVTWYLLFAEKTSGLVKVDGYTRISQSHDYASYDVDEVVRLVKTGRIPVLLLQACTRQTLPTAREIMTWWVNDHALGFPLNHAILAVEGERIELKVFSMKECFFCERKSEPIKNIELRW